MIEVVAYCFVSILEGLEDVRGIESVYLRGGGIIVGYRFIRSLVREILRMLAIVIII